MQIKIFTVPIFDSEEVQEEMNRFLRSTRVIEVESRLVENRQTPVWSFCIKYVENSHIQANTADKPKVDYMKILDEATFAKFSQLRKIRKEISLREGIPAYAVFNDDELAGIARLTEVSAQSLQTIKGIAEKKVERFGKLIISKLNEAAKDETAQPTDSANS